MPPTAEQRLDQALWETNVYANVIKLHTLGWSLIPLCNPQHSGVYPLNHFATCKRPGKQPIHRWKDRQTVRLTIEQLRDIWTMNPGLNVGVVCGLVSKIVMVDIDTQAGLLAWLEMIGPNAEPTWEFGTGRGGRHLVYRWPYPFRPDGRPFPDMEGNLDFLGEGHQSVIPPSLHKSGHRYSWTRGGPFSGLPLADAPPLLCLSSERYVPVSREPVGGESQRLAMNDAREAEKNFRRAVAYAAAFQPAIEGSGGSKVLFTLACALIHGFGLTLAEAEDIMSGAWNQKCLPPWSRKEIERAVDGANKRGHFNPIEEK